MSFAIVSDSTCDLNRALREKYDITVIKAHFKDMDGTDRLSFNDWDECGYYESGDAFFKALKANHAAFSTSAPSIAEIYETFESFAKEGKDVVAFTISSTMSGTFNFYTTAKEMLAQKFPDVNVYVVDSLRFGMGIGLMAIKASELREEGKSAAFVYDYIEKNKNRFHQMGWLDDLQFVAKTGRITHAKAFFGQLIGIKPLGECDRGGLTTVIGKVKGESKAFAAMTSYIDRFIQDAEDNVIVICHSVHAKEAEKYAALIKEKFSPKAVYITECGPSCGIHMGPGLLSAYFYGKPLSENLTEEKQAMENIISSGMERT